MIVAGFRSEDELTRALAALRDTHSGRVQTYTPTKLSDDAPDSTVSPIPLIMFAAGVLGAGFMFWLQVYADVSAYVINVGGRPNDSWPAYVTNAFEVGVLSAMGTGFAAFLIASRLPRLYDPVDECDSMREASRSGWFLSVRPDSDTDYRAIRDLLLRHRPLVVEDVKDGEAEE